MEFEIKAGGKLDLLTKAEAHDAVKGALKDWMVEAVRGAHFVRFSAQATIANGAVSVGGTDGFGINSGALGPESGFVWSVKRLVIRGINATAESASVYVNTASPFELVRDGVTGFERFGSDEFVLMGTERILVTASNLVSTGQFYVAGQALELPVGMLWKLV